MTKRIGILVHRSVAIQRLRSAFRILDRAGLTYDVQVCHAGIDPSGVKQWVEEFERREGGYIIAFDGADSLLATFAAAHSLLPVFMMHLRAASSAGSGGGLVARGQVAVMESDRPEDAISFLLRVIAVQDTRLRQHLSQNQLEDLKILTQQNSDFQQQLTELRQHDRDKDRRKPEEQADVESTDAGPPDDINVGRVVRPSIPVSENDQAMVEEFEKKLRPRLKTQPDPPPEPYAPPPLEYSLVLREVIAEARALTEGRQPALVGPLHFLGAISRTTQAGAYIALKESQTDIPRLTSAIDDMLGPALPAAAGSARPFGLDNAGEDVLTRAKVFARTAQRTCLTTVDILHALATDDDLRVSAVLEHAGTDAEFLQKHLLKDDLAQAEVAELEASLQNRLPKISPSPILDPEALKKMQERFFAASDHADPASNVEPEIIDISSDGGRESAIVENANDEVSSSEELVALAPALNSATGKRTDIRIHDPFNPDLSTVEEISDRILEGGVIATATDIGYTILADATNSAAVERVRLLSGKPASKPLSVLVHSTGVLKNLVRNLTPAVEDLLDQLWPGPLTVIFERHPKRFVGLATDPTLGIRIPDHYLTLAALSMLGRPVVASAVDIDFTQRPARVHLSEVAEALAADVDLLIDTGETPSRIRPTVLSVVGGQYRLLREGPIPLSDIQKAAGRKRVE